MGWPLEHLQGTAASFPHLSWSWFRFMACYLSSPTSRVVGLSLWCIYWLAMLVLSLSSLKEVRDSAQRLSPTRVLNTISTSQHYLAAVTGLNIPQYQTYLSICFSLVLTPDSISTYSPVDLSYEVGMICSCGVFHRSAPM